MVQISFDKDEKVTLVKKLTLKDGYQVAYDRRQTPTRGRDLTVLEQVLGTSAAPPCFRRTTTPATTSRNRH